MPRFALSLLAGWTVAALIFFFLHSLIRAGSERLERDTPAKIDFQRLIKVADAEVKKRFKPERDEAAPPPPTETLVAAATEAVNAISPIDLAPTSELLEGGAALGGIVTGRVGDGFDLAEGGSADQSLMPLVRIEPDYPERALQRGIEGYVQIEFTISVSGAVRNPRVIAYEPSPVFNRAALQAIQKWKYSPQVENGEAVEKTTQVRLMFSLEQ